MSSSTPLLLGAALLLAVLACGCQATSPCDGPQAKYRYQLFYKLKPGTKMADVEAAAKAFLDGCKAAGLVSRFGYGPSLTTSPAAFANPTKGSIVDFGAWSDWASIDNLKKCHDLSIKNGNVLKLRAFSERAVRVVLEMPPGGAGNPDRAAACAAAAAANANGVVRYMWAYVLPEGTTRAQACPKLQGLIDTIFDVHPDWVRQAHNCDAVPDDVLVFGPTIKSTVVFGGFSDFPNLQDLTKHLTMKLNSTSAARQQARAMASDIVRIAIAVPGAPTARGASTVVANLKPAAAAPAAAGGAKAAPK